MRRAFIIISLLVIVAAESGWTADKTFYRDDPHKIQGFENCAECHARITESWKQTEHYRTFFQMHRRREARRIAGRMDLTRIKSRSLCSKCHYVSKSIGDDIRAVSGVSCESCHGAALDWNKTHSYVDDPKHLDKARTRGLLSSADIYRLASKCYNCHTVPEEELVNKGGHRAGSQFELVSWVMGEVRHNLLQTDGHQNKESSVEHKRVLYVLGFGLDLEHGLRGLASATTEGDYASGMILRIHGAAEQLKKIGKRTGMVEVERMLGAMASVELTINNRAALLASAKEVGKHNEAFSRSPNQSQLAKLDALLPASDDYMGKVFDPRER